MRPVNGMEAANYIRRDQPTGMFSSQVKNGQHLSCEVGTGMCEVLTKSGLSLIYKMIHEIFSMPRADSGSPVILWSIPGFSRITSPNLRLKPTADFECVHYWSKVRTSHV